MKTVSLGPFLGVNNRLPDFALHVDQKGDYLAAADNVDIDNTGRIHSRRGTALLQAFANPPHSLHMVDATTGYAVVDSVLYPCTVGPSSVVLGTLLKVLTTNDPLSYETLAGELYYSNGTDSGRISAGVWYPLGLPTPAAPTLAITGGGSLDPAWYQVSVSYVNSTTGEEGGISPSSNVQLSSMGSIVVTLPSSTPGATEVNVYLSGPNGEVPFKLDAVAVGTATYTATAAPQGRETTGRFEVPLPPGTLFVHNAALCSFSGSSVYVGIPYRPGYCLALNSIIPFPATVSIAVSGQAGVYVAADKTYWIPGALDALEGAPLVDVLPLGAVPGTAFVDPSPDPSRVVVGWFSPFGIVLGDTQGQVTTPMQNNILLTPPASGVSAVFVEDGYRKVVSCGWCVNLENGATTTYSGWDFTSMSRGYGTQTDGVYSLLTASRVDATISLGKLNFGSDKLKFVPYMYLGVDAEYPMALTVNTPGKPEYTYAARAADADLKTQRIDIGKGLRATWFDMVITNTGGAPFTLAGVLATVNDSQRSI